MVGGVHTCGRALIGHKHTHTHTLERPSRPTMISARITVPAAAMCAASSSLVSTHGRLCTYTRHPVSAAAGACVGWCVLDVGVCLMEWRGEERASSSREGARRRRAESARCARAAGAAAGGTMRARHRRGTRVVPRAAPRVPPPSALSTARAHPLVCGGSRCGGERRGEGAEERRGNGAR